MEYKSSKWWVGGWINDVICMTFKGIMLTENAGKDNPCTC